MRKRVLFVINSMGCGGAEKSLLSLLSLLDYEKYYVTLQMFSGGGMFEELLPPEVHIREDLVCENILLNGSTFAASIIA